MDNDPRSIPVKELYLSELGERELRYLKHIGVKYLGEIPGIKMGISRHGVIDKILDVLHRYKINSIVRADYDGWVPPYWDDPVFYAGLSLSLGQTLCPVWSYTWVEYSDVGVHYVGSYLQCLRGLYYPLPTEKLKNHPLSFRSWGLHAAAFVPHGWEAPKEVPEEWQVYLSNQVGFREELRRAIIRDLVTDGRESSFPVLARSIFFLTMLGNPEYKSIAGIIRVGKQALLTSKYPYEAKAALKVLKNLGLGFDESPYNQSFNLTIPSSIRSV